MAKTGTKVHSPVLGQAHQAVLDYKAKKIKRAELMVKVKAWYEERSRDTLTMPKDIESVCTEVEDTYRLLGKLDGLMGNIAVIFGIEE